MTTAPDGLVAGTVIVPGTVITGAVVSEPVAPFELKAPGTRSSPGCCGAGASYALKLDQDEPPSVPPGMDAWYVSALAMICAALGIQPA